MIPDYMREQVLNAKPPDGCCVPGGSVPAVAEGHFTFADVVNAWPGSDIGQVHQADAADHPLPDQSASTWFTDPPYYDAVPYADLSDYFVVWLKRTLPGNPIWRNPLEPDNPLSPKVPEAVQDETKSFNGKPKDRKWFEETMERAFREGRRVLRDDGVGSVVFAHKTTEGWEALLTGMIRGGWIITGSWPIATEMGARLRAREAYWSGNPAYAGRVEWNSHYAGGWSSRTKHLLARHELGHIFGLDHINASSPASVMGEARQHMHTLHTHDKDDMNVKY